MVSSGTVPAAAASGILAGGLVAAPIEEAPPQQRQARAVLQSQAPPDSSVRAAPLGSNAAEAITPGGRDIIKTNDSADGSVNVSELPSSAALRDGASNATKDTSSSNDATKDTFSSFSNATKDTSPPEAASPCHHKELALSSIGSFSDEETPADLLAEALAVADHVASINKVVVMILLFVSHNKVTWYK